MSGQNTGQDNSYYIALIAIIISLVGTGVSIVEAKILRDQQALMVQESSASVWPYLSLSMNIGTTLTKEGFTPGLTVSLKNGGIGPAILSPRTIRFRGQAFKGTKDLGNFLAETYEGLHVVFTMDIMEDGGIIPANEEVSVINMLTLSLPEGREKLDLLSEISDDLDLDYCYCSVYEDCWTLTDDAHPSPVEDCRIKVSL